MINRNLLGQLEPNFQNCEYQPSTGITTEQETIEARC